MYDAIIDILHGVWKNGFSLTALGTAVFVLLKQRKVKNRLRRYIPWLLDDESETRHYVANQNRIEMKIDLLLKETGIEWNVITLESEREVSASKLEGLLGSRLATSFYAQSATRYTKSRRNKHMKKLKSRKFILAIVGAGLIIANDGLDLGIDKDTVLAFAGLLATWIVGEAAVDAKRAGGKNEESTTNTEHME